MIIVQPIIGSRNLQEMRAAITQRVIDCTLYPDDALLHLSFDILDKHIAKAESEISNMIQHNQKPKKVKECA